MVEQANRSYQEVYPTFKDVTYGKMTLTASGWVPEAAKGDFKGYSGVYLAVDTKTNVCAVVGQRTINPDAAKPRLEHYILGEDLLPVDETPGASIDALYAGSARVRQFKNEKSAKTRSGQYRIGGRFLNDEREWDNIHTVQLENITQLWSSNADGRSGAELAELAKALLGKDDVEPELALKFVFKKRIAYEQPKDPIEAAEKDRVETFFLDEDFQVQAWHKEGDKYYPTHNASQGFSKLSLALDHDTRQVGLIGSNGLSHCLVDLGTGSQMTEDRSAVISAFIDGKVEALSDFGVVVYDGKETQIYRRDLMGSRIHTVDAVPYLTNGPVSAAELSAVFRDIEKQFGEPTPDTEHYRLAFGSQIKITREGAEEAKKNFQIGAVLSALSFAIDDTPISAQDRRTQAGVIDYLTTVAVSMGVTEEKLQERIGKPVRSTPIEDIERAREAVAEAYPEMDFAKVASRADALAFLDEKIRQGKKLGAAFITDVTGQTANTLPEFPTDQTYFSEGLDPRGVNLLPEMVFTAPDSPTEGGAYEWVLVRFMGPQPEKAKPIVPRKEVGEEEPERDNPTPAVLIFGAHNELPPGVERVAEESEYDFDDPDDGLDLSR